MKPAGLIGPPPNVILAVANSAVPRRPSRASARVIDDPLSDPTAAICFLHKVFSKESHEVQLSSVTQGDLARLVRWRDALFALLSAVAIGNPLSAAPALALINKELKRSLGSRCLSPSLKVERVIEGGLVERLVCISADEIAACDPSRIKQCARPECSLLFYDGTRNHTARWHAENPCGWRARDARRRSSQ
jgi:predicted RNA-binding Zn ribbon-like protein